MSLKIIEKAPYDLNGKFPSFFTIFRKMKNSLGYAIQIHCTLFTQQKFGFATV